MTATSTHLMDAAKYQMPLHLQPSRAMVDVEAIPSAIAHDEFAQNALVGQMIRYPGVARTIRRILPPEAFFGLRTETIVSAIYDVLEAKQTVDIVLLFDRLRRLGASGLAGDQEALMDLADSAVSPVGHLAHARIVYEYWICRQVYGWGRALMTMWGDSMPLDVKDALRAARTTAAQIDKVAASLDRIERAERLSARRVAPRRSFRSSAAGRSR